MPRHANKGKADISREPADCRGGADRRVVNIEPLTQAGDEGHCAERAPKHNGRSELGELLLSPAKDQTDEQVQHIVNACGELL